MSFPRDDTITVQIVQAPTFEVSYLDLLLHLPDDNELFEIFLLYKMQEILYLSTRVEKTLIYMPNIPGYY